MAAFPSTSVLAEANVRTANGKRPTTQTSITYVYVMTRRPNVVAINRRVITRKKILISGQLTRTQLAERTIRGGLAVQSEPNFTV